METCCVDKAAVNVPPPMLATRSVGSIVSFCDTIATGAAAGAGVGSVTSGVPAAKAGIRPGDVITAIGGTATPDVQALSALLANARPGRSVKVSVTHSDGSTATVNVTLGQLPDSWLRPLSDDRRPGWAAARRSRPADFPFPAVPR